jgi:tetratricopeptide (TPR) repeat protein
MSEGFPDRVTQLRARWLADPSSRVFLQLAEEYRHLGRMQEALEVLDGGLREHPGYLSALVAKGRCLLELGEAEAAKGVLERVVQQDVTQMVASKLLVRAYLETGDADRARQRLELYSLLNDGDPEIEDLKRRAEAMNPPLPVEEELPAPPAAAAEAAADPFALEPPAPRGGDIFDLDSSQLAPRSSRQAVEPESVPAPPAPQAVEAFPAGDDDPFPEVTLVGRVGGDKAVEHVDHLAAEGIFWFEKPEIALPESVVAEPAAPEPESAPAAEITELPPSASPAPESASSPLTVTLGQLYQRQGHSGEAERIFRAVLERDPDNPVARAELASLMRQSQPLQAGDLLRGFVPAPGPSGGVRAKKLHMLKNYLQLLKRAARSHVS